VIVDDNSYYNIVMMYVEVKIQMGNCRHNIYKCNHVQIVET
jgi:hypothetical protein